MGLLCSERGGGTENGKAHAVGVEREKAGHHPGNLKKVSGVNLFITKRQAGF